MGYVEESTLKVLRKPIYNEFGYITIVDTRIDEICSAYFKWKDLNTYISNNSCRGINMPDAIREPMGCYCLGLLWNRGDEAGDAIPILRRVIKLILKQHHLLKEICHHLHTSILFLVFLTNLVFYLCYNKSIILILSFCNDFT